MRSLNSATALIWETRQEGDVPIPCEHSDCNFLGATPHGCSQEKVDDDDERRRKEDSILTLT